MNRFYCEREGKIIAALRAGALDAELEKHATGCAICADTLAVSECLHAYLSAAPVPTCHSEAAFSPAEESWQDLSRSTVNAETQFCASLRDSDFLWWKAQLASKQLAVERATRSIALVRKISYWGVFATALWLVFAPGHLASIMDALSKRPIWRAGVFSQTAGALGQSTGILSQTALFLGAGALVFTLLSSLYLARPEK